MSIDDEIYYETHEDTLKQQYFDFLQEFGFTEEEYPFFDFVDTF